MEDDKKVPITISLPPELLQEIDQLADVVCGGAFGRRTQVIRMFCTVGMKITKGLQQGDGTEVEEAVAQIARMCERVTITRQEVVI